MSRGGARKGAGRPTKADEEKANYLFTTALRKIYNKKDDDAAKVEFIKTLAESQRGQLFIAEHLFGKPKDIIDFTNNTPEFDFSNLTDEEINVLSKMYARKPSNTDNRAD